MIFNIFKQLWSSLAAVFLTTLSLTIYSIFLGQNETESDLLPISVLFLLISVPFIGLALLQVIKTTRLFRKTGVKDILFSREEIIKKKSIEIILSEIQDGSELFIVARTAEAWASNYHELNKVINQKGLHVVIAIGASNLSEDHLMIKDDWGKYDINSSLSKFKCVSIVPGSSGSFELFFLPTFPLFSFVHYRTKSGKQAGLLELGADLSFKKRIMFVLEEGQILETLRETYRKVLHKRNPEVL